MAELTPVQKITQAADKSEAAANVLEQIVEGDELTTVTTVGGRTHPTIQKWYKDSFSTMEAHITSEANRAETAANNSAASATNSANSATNSANSATASENSKLYAAEWANKAENTLISGAAGGDGIDDYSSLHHARKAAASASAAATSETNAASSASAAATSETNAASSASAAATSETNAASSASSASTSATNASTSETNAAASATAADTSEANAAASETKAGKWAEEAVDIEVEIGKYSAKHHATKAASSASAASTSETNAASSASAAATSETNAATSASNASTSETNAANSKSYAQEWANKGVDLLISAAAGGDGIDDYSALHWATKAQENVHTHTNKTVLDAITAAGSGSIITTAERDKLTAIEANAKDDQVASEVPYTNTTSGLTATNVQAALDELDANIDSLSGDTSTYVRNDVANAINANITWNDNHQVRVGTGGDGRFYHDGFDTYLDNHTGELRIRQLLNGGVVSVQGNDAGAILRTMILADPDNAVTIYYAGTKKLESTSTGILVTGKAETTGDVVVGGNLTVNGTTTTVNTTEVNIGDNIIVLNSDETGAPTQSAGIEVERGTSTNVSLLWDEANLQWSFGGQKVGGVANPTLGTHIGNRDYNDARYLAIGAKAVDADKLDGHDSTYFAVSTHNHDTVYLGINAKATDSEKLDGLDSTQFLRSDISDTIEGKLTVHSGGFKVQKILDPSAPVVSNIGTTGTTTYTYYVVAEDKEGNKTLASSGGSTTTGNAILDATNYNNISFTWPSAAKKMYVLKGGTGGTVLLAAVTNTATTSVNDQGQALSAFTEVTRNATGDATVDGSVNASVVNVGGSSVWHPGNFDPSTKANLDGTNTFTLLNVDNLRLDGNNVSSVNTNGDINLIPNGTGLVKGTYNGLSAFYTHDRGIHVKSTTTSGPYIGLYGKDSVRNGYLHSSNTATHLLADQNGAEIYLQSRNAGGTVTNMLVANPDGGIALYNQGTSTVEVITASSGGLQANNTLTGSGMERVLTVSDGNLKAGLADDQTFTGSNTFHGGDFQVKQVANPAAPTVANVGTTGTTTYTYYVVAEDKTGKKTLASAGGSTTTGNATLDATNYNVVSFTWPAQAVKLYILKNGTGGTVLHSTITNTATTSVNDQGQALAAFTEVTRNATGDATIDGRATVEGKVVTFPIVTTTVPTDTTGTSHGQVWYVV